MRPRTILLAGWLGFLLYAYPGYMQVDAGNMLFDSRTGVFTDWQSPVMTELWRIVGRVISGPAGMLVVQSLLLLGGTYVLLRRLLSERAAAIAAVCVLVFPPALATTALISPEAQLAGWLVAGAAALSCSRPAVRIAGSCALAIACGMRAEAAWAALPIAIVMVKWRDYRGWRRYSIALLAWCAVVGFAWGANQLLTDSESRTTEVKLAMADITATLRDAPPLPDTKLLPMLAGTPLAVASDVQTHARNGDRLFDKPRTPDERDALIAARGALIRALPGVYAHERFRLWMRQLGFTRSWPALYTDFTPPNAREPLHHAASHSLLQRVLIVPVRWLSHTFLFRPHVYMIAALLLLPFALVRRARLAAMFLASAIAYELSLAVTTTQVELRESHWTIVATCIAFAVLVTRGWAKPS